MFIFSLTQSSLRAPMLIVYVLTTVYGGIRADDLNFGPFLAYAWLYMRPQRAMSR